MQNDRLKTVLLGVVLVASWVAAFYVGRVSSPAAARLAALVEETSPQVKEIADLKSELAVQEKRHELDRRALEMVRSDIAKEKQQVAKLDEELQFYRTLMTPKSVKQGVSIRSPEVVAIADDEFAFRLMAQQRARQHATVKGEVQVSLHGVSEGQPVVYGLSELSSEVEEAEIPLGFRYFQTIEGQLALPKGFTPQVFVVEVQISKPKPLTLREEFPWQLQERFAYVGQ